MSLQPLNKFIIFVPVYNFGSFLEECIESILKQIHTNWICLLWDDGSTDNSNLICEKYKGLYPDKFIVKKNIMNEGPASTKYYFLKILKTISDPNDIAIILDGDDNFIGDDSLDIINKAYNDTKCWMTYGSFEGMWQEQTVQLPRENDVEFRKIPWRYGHPRSFKCFFGTMFCADDFKYSDSTWLKKGTDRPLIFHLLEWSQKRKIKYINKPIYNYRTHDNNTWKLIDNKTSWLQKEYVNKKITQPQFVEKIHIVMASWKRVKNIPKIINLLKLQTVSNRIHFHIVNNNKEELENIDNIVKCEKDLHVTVKHYENKYFGFQRFLYIRDELLKKELIDYAIMIDDDLSFGPEWVEDMFSKAKPRNYIGFYGKRFDPVHVDYWTVGWHTTCRKNFHRNMIKMDYVATCGCIIDCSIFNPASILWDIPKDIPDGVSVYNIEDLWLSYISNQIGWSNQRSFNPMEVIEEEDPTIAQFFDLKEKKTTLLKYLIEEKNWLIINRKSNIGFFKSLAEKNNSV
jgi:glycosyltransferase involved in cell wall biosynthesis